MNWIWMEHFHCIYGFWNLRRHFHLQMIQNKFFFLFLGVSHYKCSVLALSLYTNYEHHFILILLLFRIDWIWNEQKNKKKNVFKKERQMWTHTVSTKRNVVNKHWIVIYRFVRILFRLLFLVFFSSSTQ